MYNAQAKECRTREAESLEQAKQTRHNELKPLHETIARQWRRLAEVLEASRGDTQLPVHNGRDIAMLGGKADLAPHSPHAFPGEQVHAEISETDDDAAKELSLQHEISEIDLTVARLGPVPECIASIEEQCSEIHRAATQSSAWAEGIERSSDPISEADHGILSVSGSRDNSPAAHRQSPDAEPGAVPVGFVPQDFPNVPEQFSDAFRDITQSNLCAESIENSNDQISEADHGILCLSASADSSPTTHRHRPEDEPGAVPLGFLEDCGRQQDQVSGALRDMSEGNPEGIETSIEQFRETDQDTACVRAGVEGSQGADDQILRLDPRAQVDPDPAIIALSDGQISEAVQDAAELSPGAEAVGNLAPIAAQLSAGVNHPILGMDPGAAPPTPTVDSLQSLGHPISETDHASPGSERIGCPDNPIFQNVHTMLRDNSTADSAKSAVAQISETNHPDAQQRSTGRIETPLEWVLSFWLKGGARN